VRPDVRVRIGLQRLRSTEFHRDVRISGHAEHARQALPGVRITFYRRWPRKAEMVDDKQQVRMFLGDRRQVIGVVGQAEPAEELWRRSSGER
jgi:hypothetical protein